MNNELKVCITFAPIKYDTIIDFEKVISRIESVSDFELTSKESYRVEFSSNDKRKELLIHSDGMVDIYMAVDDIKRDLPTLIEYGYGLIKRLKEIDLRCRKKIGVVFSGMNVDKVYKDEETKIRETIERISGAMEVEEYITDTFSRIDYRPSEILL